MLINHYEPRKKTKEAMGLRVNILAASHMMGMCLVNEITGVQKLFLNNEITGIQKFFLNNRVSYLIMLSNATNMYL